jgi:Fe-S-cluster-containing hydrogenase component 2
MVVQINSSLCVGCGCCSDVCSTGALEMTEDTAVLYAEYCVGCGSCIAMCPAGALGLDEG